MSNAGLDFGTTYTVISHIANGELKAVEPGQGSQATQPSVVVKSQRGIYSFGANANNMIGRPGHTVLKGFKMLLTESENEDTERRFIGEDTPEAVTQRYLDNVIKTFCNRTGQEKIDRLVVGVPQVWFSNGRLADCRVLLKDKILAGIEDVKYVRLVSEPAAACAYFVYNYKQNTGNDFVGRILMIDYGGGTLDIALCDVEQNGANSQITVIKETGAGENHDGKPGDAGLTFLESLAKHAIMSSGSDFTGAEIGASPGFQTCVSNLENDIISKTVEIRERFEEEPIADYENIQDELCSIYLNNDEYSVTYGMVAKVYNQTISPVLSEKIKEMQQFMRNKNMDFSANTRDEFKIAMVGGFCNFYLVQREICELFNFGLDLENDRRTRDIIRDSAACERAISYGAALIAEGRVDFRQTAPYSLGIATNDGNNLIWAVAKGTVIQADKQYFLTEDKGVCENIKSAVPILTSGTIPRIAWNYTDDLARRDSREVADSYRPLLALRANVPYKIAFSFDESSIVSIHKYECDWNMNPINEPISVVLARLIDLFGGYVTLERG